MSIDERETNPKIPTPPIPPGNNAALPAGSLPKPFLGPQGDENRDPPPTAPAPVNPTATVPKIDQDPVPPGVAPSEASRATKPTDHPAPASAPGAKSSR